MNAMGFDAEAASQGQVIELGSDQIDTFEVFPLCFWQAEAAAAQFQNLVLGVVADDEDHGNVVTSRRPEPLNTVGGGAFAQQGQHRSLGPGQLYADRDA